MLDLSLAILHHLMIFMLMSVLSVEFVLLRTQVSGTELRLLSRVDAGYGLLAVLIVVVGICRVHFGLKGAAYYTHNLFFWMKMAAFIVLGLCSIPPTLTFMRWRKANASDPAVLPSIAQIVRARRWLQVEVCLFAFIPIFAAVMARFPGYITF